MIMLVFAIIAVGLMIRVLTMNPVDLLKRRLDSAAEESEPPAAK
jgi:hypothetical protein